MNGTVLLIDTSSNKKIKVGLNVGGKEHFLERELGKEKNQVLLNLIDELLRKNKLLLKDLTAIEVNVGPGSFTGLRVGVSVANSLSYSLKIPVNGKLPPETVEPTYD